MTYTLVNARRDRLRCRASYTIRQVLDEIVDGNLPGRDFGVEPRPLNQPCTPRLPSKAQGTVPFGKGLLLDVDPLRLFQCHDGWRA